MPHRFDESVAAERRKVTCQDHSFGGGARQRRNAFGKEVDVKQCVICAAKCEIPGTTKWWGVGQYSYMADLTTDHQPMRLEASRLRAKAGLAGVKWCDYCHVADHSSRTCPQYGTQQHVQAAKEGRWCYHCDAEHPWDECPYNSDSEPARRRKESERAFAEAAQEARERRIALQAASSSAGAGPSSAGAAPAAAPPPPPPPRRQRRRPQRRPPPPRSVAATSSRRSTSPACPTRRWRRRRRSSRTKGRRRARRRARPTSRSACPTEQSYLCSVGQTK